MSFKVVNAKYLADTYFGEKLLEPLGVTIVNGDWNTEEEIIANARDADAIIGMGSIQPFNRRVLSALLHCRIFASTGVGYDNTDVGAATDLGVVVTNVPDYSIDEVSGRAIALILALGHKLLQLDKAVKERQACFLLDRRLLKEVAYPIFRMRDQTVGIIGLGRIGTATAIKARGLGMRVIAFDPYVYPTVMQSLGIEPAELDALLAEADYVSIHSPLTTETRGMLGYEQLEKMKPTSYVINVARGDCIDEPALILALQKGIIAGAGLDVTAEEVISADNPLLNMENVILTGHSAHYSEEAHADLWVRPATQILMALRGEFPRYAINPQVKKLWLEKWGPSGSPRKLRALDRLTTKNARSA